MIKVTKSILHVAASADTGISMRWSVLGIVILWLRLVKQIYVHRCECGFAFNHAFIYIYIHMYTLFGVRNSRTCASDSAWFQHIRRCPSMCLHGRACATLWIRVLCACSTTARKTDAVLYALIARVQMCVVNLLL